MIWEAMLEKMKQLLPVFFYWDSCFVLFLLFRWPWITYPIVLIFTTIKISLHFNNSKQHKSYSLRFSELKQGMCILEIYTNCLQLIDTIWFVVRVTLDLNLEALRLKSLTPSRQIVDNNLLNQSMHTCLVET